MTIDKFKEYIVAENNRIVLEIYNDYINSDNKEMFVRHVKRTAKSFIQYKGSELNDWLEQFKNEELVIKELKQLYIE